MAKPALIGEREGVVKLVRTKDYVLTYMNFAVRARAPRARPARLARL